MRRYTKAQEKLDADLLKRREIRTALEKGLQYADKFDKPYDKAVCILIHLESAGFNVVRKASTETRRPAPREKAIKS